VIPTYNERENLEPLLERIDAACRAAGIDYEAIVVDDDSPDGTAKAAAALASRFPLRLIVRRGARGLATAVARGFEEARGEVVAAIDADLSHPPESLPALAGPVLEGEAEMAVGSRYVAGGAIDRGWPFYRRLASRVAIALARPLAPVRDLTSGFFCVRRAILEGIRLRPLGYKIGLEVLVRARPRRVFEVPIEFKDRERGETKFGLREQVLFILHLLRLYPARLFGRRAGALLVPLPPRPPAPPRQP
jgi:dolichol-phosphate mannosyltransferase